MGLGRLWARAFGLMHGEALGGGAVSSGRALTARTGGPHGSRRASRVRQGPELGTRRSPSRARGGVVRGCRRRGCRARAQSAATIPVDCSLVLTARIEGGGPLARECVALPSFLRRSPIRSAACRAASRGGAHAISDTECYWVGFPSVHCRAACVWRIRHRCAWLHGDNMKHEPCVCVTPRRARV